MSIVLRPEHEKAVTEALLRSHYAVNEKLQRAMTQLD